MGIWLLNFGNNFTPPLFEDEDDDNELAPAAAAADASSHAPLPAPLGSKADEEVEKVFTELASKVTSRLPSVQRATPLKEAALAVPGTNVVLQRPERA